MKGQKLSTIRISYNQGSWKHIYIYNYKTEDTIGRNKLQCVLRWERNPTVDGGEGGPGKHS